MIKTRFSPSPSGRLHIGNVRSALFSAFYAMKTQGAFILRIEDTDATRSEKKFVDLLEDDLRWLGIEWQEGPGVQGPSAPYFQSERQPIYAHYYQTLETLGKAYPCFCSDQELALNRKVQLSRGQAPRYPGTCRQLSSDEVKKRLALGLKPALRFVIPLNTLIEFDDIVKGPQQFKSDDIGDFIIRRADGSSSFLFCNAIDDSLMGVTHVIRGEDHLTNTPRQLMLLNALQMQTPHYAHLSLILGDDGGKLSKRHGSFSLYDLREEGYLPIALLNYLARLSHRYEEMHLFSFNELAEHFQLEKLSRAPARFDSHQLAHWQKIAVLAQDSASFWKWVGPHSVPLPEQDLFREVMQQNCLFPKEVHHWMTVLFGSELSFNREEVTILEETGPDFFQKANDLVGIHGSDIKIIIDQLKSFQTGKKLFMPLRIALTGETHGPELHYIARLLGASKMQERFQRAGNIATK